MTQTQAQIEAAAWLVCPNETVRCQKLCGRCLVKARKILTAAAGVGEPQTSHAPMVCPDCGIVHSWPSNQCSTCAVKLVPLAAAAEVGGPTLTNLPPEEQREAHKWMDHQLVAATIERCAQWLKERDRSPHVHFLADKMCSALKDKP